MDNQRYRSAKNCGIPVFITVFGIIALNSPAVWAETLKVSLGDSPCLTPNSAACELDTGGLPIGELPGKPTDFPVGELQRRLVDLNDEAVAGVYQTLAGLGQTMATAGMLASALTQDIISAALDGDLTPDAGSVSPMIVSGSAMPGGPYMVSGYKHRSHEGYSVESAFAPLSGKTPGFEEDNYGLTVGGRFDGSDLIGAAPNTVTLGVMGNYTRTEIDIDAPASLPFLDSGGSASIDSWSLGTFGVVTDGTRYGLVSVTGTFGSPETETTVVGPVSAAFNNYAVATSAVVGVLVPVGGAVRLDLRGGLDYIYARSDDFEDSLGVDYTDGHMQDFSGSVSARLFSVIKTDGYDIRPFVQAGLSQRFHYESELTVDGVAFSFDEADTSVFGRAGIDFSLSQTAQAYLAVRGDASEDFEAISAQFGLTFKLD